MMNRCIYLFCWLCLACWSKPVSAEGQALLVIPEPGEKTLIHSENRMVTGSCTGYGVDNAFGEWFVSGP